MLSRVAESMYWMARYIERAEDITRLLMVNFSTLLDSQPEDARDAWLSILRANGDDAQFAEIYGTPNAQVVLKYMFYEPSNLNSVTSCVIQARENARSVREQISTEMWEAINRLYFTVRDADWQALLANPTAFSQRLRNRAQAVQGIASATMAHKEPYQFIQLGIYLERADKTARILSAKHQYLKRFEAGSPEISLQLIALLRSCSAFEPYRRAQAGQITISKVIPYLLVNRDFPRAILFCLNHALHAFDEISGDSSNTSGNNNTPRRALGRLSANLEYLDTQEILGDKLEDFLTRFLDQLNNCGQEIARQYFNTSVILPDERPRQQQQQQQ